MRQAEWMNGCRHARAKGGRGWRQRMEAEDGDRGWRQRTGTHECRWAGHLRLGLGRDCPAGTLTTHTIICLLSNLCAARAPTPASCSLPKMCCPAILKLQLPLKLGPDFQQDHLLGEGFWLLLNSPHVRFSGHSHQFIPEWVTNTPFLQQTVCNAMRRRLGLLT